MNTKHFIIKTAKILFIVVAAMNLFNCATPRTKWTDKTMRVMIDPENISAEDHARIQTALVKSKKFVVVDRAAGFRAIKKEQERLHRDENDRFADREKFAIWGRMFGVGGIVVAHTQCHDRHSTFGGNFVRCSQYLAIMDSNTAETIAVAEGEEDGDSGFVAPKWDHTVAELIDAYPSHFERDQTHEKLREYQLEAREEAIRQKEEHARKMLELSRQPASVKVSE